MTLNKIASFHNEIPMRQIIATEKELEHRLWEKELELATKCSPGKAFVELTMKVTGKNIWVTRERRYKGKKHWKPGYWYTVQILTSGLEVLKTYSYHESDENPLFQTAVDLIQMNRID